MVDCFAGLNTANGGKIIAHAFQENTSFCGCLPLTEYDENGNHRWRISVTIQNGRCCKADYICREGDKDLLYTRFCLPHSDWNDTVPECNTADTTEDVMASTALNHVAIPGVLLSLLIVCMILFIVWWRRQAVSEGRAEDERNSTEEDTDNIKGNDIHNLVLDDIQITTTGLDKNQSDSSVGIESSLPTQYRNKVYCHSNGIVVSNSCTERDSRLRSYTCSTRTTVSGSDNQLESGNGTGRYETFETKL